MKTIKETASFEKLLKWRGEIAFAAILAIAVLHFAFQFSFIRSETGENSRADGFPVKIEKSRPQIVETESAPAEIKAKKKPETNKSGNFKSSKTAPPVGSRPTEIAPVQPLPKKKVPVESRAARLRRAERILTGI